ncbi:MAG: YdcF family protein [Pseudomonadota bacterium]
MDTAWLVTNLVAGLLLPPLNLLLLAAAGFWLARRRPRLGRGLMLAAFAGLWLLATPWVGDRLLATLQTPYQPIRGDEAEAIVILGGGSKPAPEYGGDRPSQAALERLRYGAHLARQTGRPVLVSGGAPQGGRPEGQIMAEALAADFRVPATWVEDRSRNTWENAEYSARLLEQAGIRRIYLVSQAWHLPRAVPVFERAGLTVVPAGTGYAGLGPITPVDFLPSGRGLKDSDIALHEVIGLIWYRIRN